MVVDDIKLSQLTGVAQPAWTDRVFSVTANSLIGLDANKRPINITLDPATMEIVDGVLYAIGGGGGGGGVSSVGLSMPSIFNVTGSPVTTSGTLTAALATQTANLVFAGPSSGGAAVPGFRLLVPGDIPGLSAVYQPLNVKLSAISALANAVGWLHNDGAGGFAYTTPSQSDVGLGNVDNTSDLNKPISTATQTALNLKASAATVAAHIADVANPHSVTKTQVGLGNADNTSDVNKPVSTATQTALDLKANLTLLGAVSGIATLGVDQKLTASQLPSIAVTEFLGSVASQAAMLALTGEEGDWCIRTDTGLTYVITGPDPTQLSDWTSLSYPTAPVLSVAGRTGVVVLTSADVGLGNVDNTADSAKAFTAAQITSGTFAATLMPAFTGDATSTVGTVALTVVKINGVSLAGLATGILKNTTGTGVPSIAIAADFPTLNQSTTGSAATLTTARSIYGNNFNGSADLAQIITSVFGGTGNGFTKFSGPASTEKTFTLPNVSATILTDNAVITGAQGGTGVANTSKTITIGANFVTSGAFALTLTVTAITNVTLPTTGTLATLAGSEALSNKTITLSAFNGTIGVTTPSTAVVTTLQATSIGATTPGTGAFTSLTATSGGVTGTGTTFWGITAGGTSQQAYIPLTARTTAPANITWYLVNAGGVASDKFQIKNDSAVERFSLTQAGLAAFNVGGTNSITITNASDATTYGILSMNGAFASNTMIGLLAGGGTDPNLYFRSGTSGIFRFSTAGTTTAEISASGSLTLGSSGAVAVLMTGSGNVDAAVVFQASNSQTNWRICTITTVVNGLEFIPSTAAGGSTYTTPTMYMTPGIMTVQGKIQFPANASVDKIYLFSNVYGLGIDSTDTVLFGAAGAGTSIRADGNGGTLICRFTTGGIRFATYGAGTLVTDASGNITATSDMRLKDFHSAFKRGVSDLRKLTPIFFKWKKGSGCDSSGLYAGFSAQNVKENIPEAVGEMNNKERHLTISDRPILASVVNAIKEIDERLAKLEKLALAL